MLNKLLLSGLLVSCATVVRGGDVQDVLERFHAIRPQQKDLVLYGLDWAPTLKEAKARAASEHRPIFLIIVTNSFGNIYTGHC